MRLNPFLLLRLTTSETETKNKNAKSYLTVTVKIPTLLGQLYHKMTQNQKWLTDINNRKKNSEKLNIYAEKIDKKEH